jgi:glycosyltransferase involved in cell wall biosynthesis
MNEIQSDLPKEISQIHIWSYKELLDVLPNENWLIKHAPQELNKSLPYQLLWQNKSLPVEAKLNGIDILLNTDAGTVCTFQPSVTMSRDMLSYEAGEMRRFGISFQRLRLVFLRYVQNYSLKNSTAAIFLTKYASDVIQTYSGKIDNYKIIPHGISDNFRLEEIHKDFNLGDEIKCIYVSNVSYYKHQNHVAEAIAELRNKYNIKIKFVGGGEGKPQENFIKLREKLDPENLFLEQLDFVKHYDLPSLIKNSDLFIFASSCENMPNTLIEGMCSGLPIACSNRGPMPEVLKDGGVYFDPENKESIIDAIESLIVNRDVRLDSKKKALNLSQKYSWKRCANETFNYLVEVHKKNKN